MVSVQRAIGAGTPSQVPVPAVIATRDLPGIIGGQ